MTTILKIGHYCLALPPGANVAAILKALASAKQVRQCYSAESPVRYRGLHDSAAHGAIIEVVMVDSRHVAGPSPTFDDYGEEIEMPARRGLQIGNGE